MTNMITRAFRADLTRVVTFRHGHCSLMDAPEGSASSRYASRWVPPGRCRRRDGGRVGDPALTRQSRALVPAQVGGQVEDAVVAKAPHLPSGLRVERAEHVAGHDDKDPFVARAIRPVSDAAVGASCQRIDDVGPSQQVAGRPPVPQQLAGGGIECHDIAIDARRRVHHAIDDQRADLHLVRGPGTEVPRRPAPGISP
jgi:hypothetical protein